MLLVLAVGSGIAAGMPAQAEVPTSPCCDSDLSSDEQIVIPADPDGSECLGTCTRSIISSTLYEWNCDSAAYTVGTLQGAKVVAVWDDPSDGGSRLLCPIPSGGFGGYCTFGVNAYGNDFYCQLSPDEWMGRDMAGVNIYGAPDDDQIQLWWEDGSEEYNLDAYSTTTFVGRAFGFQGDDDIQGSRADNAYYNDLLAGGADADKVCGLDGDDMANGDGGPDDVCGDNGEDVVDGGGEPDYLCGNADDDVIVAGPGNDILDGGGQTLDDMDGETHVSSPPGDTCTNVAGSTANCETLTPLSCAP